DHPDLAPLLVSVNLSPRQLRAPQTFDLVRSTLEDTGIDPSMLCLEITESALLDDGDTAVDMVARLKDLGTRIAIDDFGTGYASLAYLKRFPVDVLKIDRSFVAGLGNRPLDRSIVKGIVNLAQAVGVVVVAEGVEEAAQLHELRALGCAQGQGFLWSPAVPASETSRWISRNRRLGQGASRTAG
ncbi:MAG: EAL domain-containing protein, partial [Candidatus Dormibacteria bacterium]